MNENRKGTDLCATDEVLIKRANEEFELQLDQWAAEIAAQYSRGSTYIQAGAFLTKVELEDLRKGLYE